MSPILGVVASSITGKLSTTAFESIQTYTGTGTPSSITFSSIPQSYKHLQLVTLTNNNRTVGGPTGSGAFQFNGDTTSTNYWTHALYGQGNIAQPAAFSANENYGVQWIGNSTTFVATVYDILDYTNTSKRKTVRITTGFDINTNAGGISTSSLLWVNSSAINQIVLTGGGYNWGANSRFALYGIKG